MAETPSTQPATTTPPTPEYDRWNVDQIKEWAATLRSSARTAATEKLREAAIAYETAHQNRPEVLQALQAPSA